MQNSIKERRKKACLTQEELAKKANISRTHLAEIENGNAIPSVLVAQKIAKNTPAKPKTNKKIQEAAKLPTAPEVGGSTKGDIVWDTPTITDYINSGRMDEIPPNVLKRIMGQQIAPGDYEE